MKNCRLISRKSEAEKITVFFLSFCAIMEKIRKEERYIYVFETKMSAGDLMSLRIKTLDFEEFVDAFGKREAYDSLQLYGTETVAEFEEISGLFRLYMEIGGYPAEETEYLQNVSKDECREYLEDVIYLFCAESNQYVILMTSLMRRCMTIYFALWHVSFTRKRKDLM